MHTKKFLSSQILHYFLKHMNILDFPIRQYHTKQTALLLLVLTGLFMLKDIKKAKRRKVPFYFTFLSMTLESEPLSFFMHILT
jgi:hypothetical protein